MVFRSLHCAAAALVTAALPTAALADDGAPASLQQAIGSDAFSIEGRLRLRYESFDNNFRPGGVDGADLFTVQTLLEGEYVTGPVRFGAQLRDVRAYGADSSTPISTSHVNALELIEAYASVKLSDDFAGGKAELTGGRFLLNLGSKRLVGNPGFRSTANAFTGARFDWTGSDKTALTLFYTFPQQRLPGDKASLLDNRIKWDREGDDLVFWGGFLSMPDAVLGLTAELYAYGLDENDRSDRSTVNRHLVTPGARLYVKPSTGAVDAEFEAAYQGGSIRESKAVDAARLTVAAYTAHAELGYTMASNWAPRLSVRFDIASGDHDSSSNYNRFDPLFGPRRSDWGPTGIFGPLGRENLVSVGAKLEIKPSKRVDALVGWRNLWLESATDSFSKTGVSDAAGLSGRHAGHHVEARVRYWLVPKRIQIDLGGAVLTKGRFLDNAPNATAFGNTVYGYSDLTISF